jgi:hypothetical protein
MKVCQSCQCSMSDDAVLCPSCGAAASGGLFGRLRSWLGGSGSASQRPVSAPSTSTPDPGDVSGPFAFEVDDVFTIKGRGTVVTGRVGNGRIAVGDEVAFRTPRGERRRCRISGIEMFRQFTDEARAGDNVGLLLPAEVGRDDVARGTRIERA